MRWTTSIVIAASLMIIAPAGGEKVAPSFAVARDKLLVSVSINGVGPYPFLLDWHVGRPVVDRDAAQFLKLKAVPDSHIEAQDAAGHMGAASAVQVDQFQVAGLPADAGACLVMDLADFRALLGTPVAGVLNVRPICGALDLDFDSSALTIKPKNCGPVLRATDDGVVRFKFADSGSPVANALINGQHARDLAIDLASGDTIAMGRDMLKALGLLTDATPRLRISPAPQEAGGELGITQIRLRSVRVGGAEVREPICLVAPDAIEPRLGLGFLKHFRVTFDLNEGLLRLDPIHAGAILEVPVTATGISLAHFRDGYWNIWVATDSPAARAGLESGAALLEIGGKDARDLSYPAAMEQLAVPPDATLDVTVTWRGEVRKASLRAEKLL